MYTREARELIWDLHEWAARVGPDKAVGIAIEVSRRLPDGIKG